MKNSRDDLTGRRFGRLMVKAYHATKNKTAFWECLCECGVTKIVRAGHLKRGNTISCGCFRRGLKPNWKHGYANKTAEYRTWNHMLNRCYNSNVKDYKNYGGRGIEVCERWLKFENFLEDMGHRPSKGYSIERKDCNKGYSPENCKWADSYEQANNKRNNIKYTHKGKALTLFAWAREPEVAVLGIDAKTLWARINKYKWPVEKSLTTPNRSSKKLLAQRVKVDEMVRRFL